MGPCRYRADDLVMTGLAMGHYYARIHAHLDENELDVVAALDGLRASQEGCPICPSPALERCLRPGSRLCRRC